MNQTFKQMNAALQQDIGRGFGKEAMMQALMAAQKNNKRTEIDPDRIDLKRAAELTRMLAEEDDLGTVIRPIPYSEIENDTEATLNIVMHALGLYTFPTKELTDWLHSEIDDNPELEPHSASRYAAAPAG